MEGDQAAVPLILIGPMPNSRSVPGGTKVSFFQLAKFFESASRWRVEVIDVSRPARSSRVLVALMAARTFLAAAWRLWSSAESGAVVVVNLSPRGLLAAGPWFWLISRLAGAIPIARAFGGDFDIHLGRARKITARLAKSTILATPVLLQTKALIREVPDFVDAHWLPTVRDVPRRFARVARPCARRLIFLAQLRPEKGIREFLSVSELIPCPVEFLVYGPQMAGFSIAEFDRYPNVTYGGALDNNGAIEALSACDVLVFPTYYCGEGYPGVVIEALQCGVPVIASAWKSISEIVDDGVSGVLVEPRSVSSLTNAVRNITEDHQFYRKLCRGAAERGEAFRAGPVFGRLDAFFRAQHEGKTCAG